MYYYCRLKLFVKGVRNGSVYLEHEGRLNTVFCYTKKLRTTFYR